ncbi:MAG: hypothetical protein GKS04_04170 [Candidatus Mycalebacterium zealandia]|nr:MAG: hypothetical protein GKS04_04170 [Candidatus Mycalebacterium zealandia]
MGVEPYTLFTGDNLPIMRGMDDESIDLIYLDPPFNKKKIFEAPIGSGAEGAKFEDTWKMSDVKSEEIAEVETENKPLANLINLAGNIGGNSYKAYLIFMALRLIQMRRILKNTGSIYLHCDPTMSHWLKLLMDAVFGVKNFRSEITWKRATSTQKGSQHKNKKWGDNADIVLYFAKSNKTPLNPLRQLTEEEIEKKFPKTDENGRAYNTATPLFRAKSMGERPNLCYEWRGFRNPHPSGWRLSKERLEEEYQKGNIVISTNKKGMKIERRAYADYYKGATFGNIWDDIKPVSGQERTHYPTQKPLALLDRIIKASSNEGDMVFDPFCGCATTPIAVAGLNRKWIGIDLSKKAVELVQSRMRKDLFVYWEKGKTPTGFKPIVIHRDDVPIRSDRVKQSPNIKHMKYGEQEGCCACDGNHFLIQNLTIDHDIPRSKGGTDDDSNLVLLCGLCNSIKGAGRTLSEAKARYKQLYPNEYKDV